MWSRTSFAAMVVAVACSPAWATLNSASGDMELKLNYAQVEPIHQLGDSSAPARLAMLQDYDDYDDDGWGPDTGEWEFTLSGTGTSDEDFDSTAFGATFSIGYFFTDNLEIALRQAIFVADGDDDDGDDTDFSGSTRAALDWHFDLDHWQPFVGASFGGTYGDAVNDTWTGGLEGGVKWYVKPETFIFAMIEWLWFFEDTDDIGDEFDDGQWFYTLGIGFNF